VLIYHHGIGTGWVCVPGLKASSGIGGIRGLSIGFVAPASVVGPGTEVCEGLEPYPNVFFELTCNSLLDGIATHEPTRQAVTESPRQRAHTCPSSGESTGKNGARGLLSRWDGVATQRKAGFGTTDVASQVREQVQESPAQPEGMEVAPVTDPD
jgi:hypothetical protein